MTSETMYTPKGAGHNAPEGGRKGYVQPRQPLVEAFGNWLRKLEGRHGHDAGWRSHFSTESLRGVDLEGATCGEINSILVPFEGHPRLCDAGTFLTRAYEMAGIADAVFESDVHVEKVDYGMTHEGIGWLGRESLPGMSLVLLSNTGPSTAMGSRGTTLNYANCCSLGAGAPGVVVNYGEVSGTLGMSSDGTLINFGRVGIFNSGESAYVLDFGRSDWVNAAKDDTRPIVSISIESGKYRLVIDWLTGYEFTDEMKQYLDDLRDRIGPHRHYTEVLAHLKGTDIKGDIRKGIRDMGVDLPEEFYDL